MCILVRAYVCGARTHEKYIAASGKYCVDPKCKKMVYFTPSQSNCHYCLSLDPPTGPSSSLDNARDSGLISDDSVGAGNNDPEPRNPPASTAGNHYVVSSGTQLSPDQSNQVMKAIDEALADDLTSTGHPSVGNDAAIAQAIADLDAMYIETPNKIALPPSDGNTPGNATLSPNTTDAQAYATPPTTPSSKRSPTTNSNQTATTTGIGASAQDDLSKITTFPEEEKTDESGAQEMTDAEANQELGLDEDEEDVEYDPDQTKAGTSASTEASAQAATSAPTDGAPAPSPLTREALQDPSFHPAPGGNFYHPRDPRRKASVPIPSTHQTPAVPTSRTRSKDRITATTLGQPAPMRRGGNPIFPKDDENTESNAGTGVTGKTQSTAATDLSGSHPRAAEEGKENGKKDS